MNESQTDAVRPPPALSALVVTLDTYETVRAVMQTLKQQTVASQIELVLVVPYRATAVIDLNDLRGFYAWQVVEVGNALHAAALAVGVRHARAPIVALTEDHCFPFPDWAERLIAAHARNYTVVSPAVRNGNPATLVSWADFYLSYSQWAEPIESGEVDLLMGHNSSYKRDALLAYDDHLVDAFEAETVLQWDLRAHGHRLWLEAETSVRHMNYEQVLPSIRIHWYHARLFAGQRAAQWNLGKRALYVFGAPLIPVVRFVRIRRGVRRAKFPLGFRLKLYGLIAGGLLVDAAGQAAGYAFGAGTSNIQASEHEFHRERFYRTGA